MNMVSIRIAEEDRQAGMAAPMPECPVYERFGLLIRRGLAQEKTANDARELALDDVLTWLDAHRLAAKQRYEAAQNDRDGLEGRWTMMQILLDDLGAIGGGK